MWRGPPAWLTSKQALFQTGVLREAAEALQSQRNSFRSSLWGIQTIGTTDFFPLKDHHTWQGTDAPLQYLDFDAVEVSRVCYSGGCCLEKHIVSTVMPGAVKLFHCLKAPPA